MDVQEVESEFVLKAEGVKYRTSGPGKSPIGVIAVYKNRIEWSAPDYAEKLVVPFSRIKSQRISPPNKPRVQLQLCMDNDDQATFVFMEKDASKEKLQKQRDLVREALQNALIAHRKRMHEIADQAEKSGNREFMIKQKILEDNAYLQSMYLHLVKEKLISAQDFWALHYKSNDDTKSSNVGISGGFLSSIEQSHGMNGVKLSLTVDVISAIFRTYPAVEKKHYELVPHEMTEEEFWSKFFQSHYFHRERAAGETGANDPFADCAKVDEKDMRDIVNRGVCELKRQRNLSYLDEDFGILNNMHDNQATFKSSKVKSMLVRRCNYHSERVLSTIRSNDSALHSNSGSKGQINNNAAFDMELESQELEELQRESAEALNTFNMPCSSKDIGQNRYQPHDVERFKSIVRHCSSGSIFEKNMSTAFLDAITSDVLDVDDSSKEVNCFAGLNSRAIEEIRIVHGCLAELLRHFWLCFPPVTPELEEKMHRMYDTLLSFEKKQLQNCEQQYGTFYVEHCLEMLNKAKERFNVFLAVKKQRKK